ncbi:MAG: hypothetical protein AAFR96_13620 [Planctomycetota bacterium]
MTTTADQPATPASRKQTQGPGNRAPTQTKTGLQPAPLARQGTLAVGIIGAPLALSALVGLVVALKPSILGGSQPLFMLAIFEAITALSGITLILLALGRYREGPALTAGLAAFAVAVGAVLGSVSTNNQIGSLDLRPLVIARLAAAAGIGIGGLALSLRSAASLIRLVVGAMLVVPVVAALGLFLLGRLAGIIDRFDALHPAVSLSAAIAAGIAALVAVSAGGHLIIRAFEPDPRDPAAPKP